LIGNVNEYKSKLPHILMTDLCDYDKIIMNIARNHRIGMLSPRDINEAYRKDIVAYAKRNEAKIDDILHRIGYTFATCTNYSAFDEIVSFIEGTPYIEVIANEVNDRKFIKVHYYPFLLSHTVFEKSQYIYGEYFDIIFNSLTGTIRTEANMIQFVTIHALVNCGGMVETRYEIVPKRHNECPVRSFL
jgi:hypothetical protein